MLKVESLVVSYGPLTAADKVSFEVSEGEAVALLGANGAGKTTVMHAISGVVPVDAGTIHFSGQEVQNRSIEVLFCLGIVQVPEGRHCIPGLSVADNLLLGGASRVPKASKQQLKKDRDEVMDIFPALKKVYTRSCWSLSGGEQQMCAVARALMGRPKILLLDEPSQGLAPVVAEEMFEQIKAINRRGITILLVEQNAHIAMDVCSRVYVMQLGKIVYSNSSSVARNDSALIDSYLGESGH